MADIQVVLTLKEEDLPNIQSGLLEVYPNTSEDSGTPLPDDIWLLSLPGKILTEIVKDGLKRKAAREAAQANQQSVTATIQVTLPDGTVISG